MRREKKADKGRRAKIRQQQKISFCFIGGVSAVMLIILGYGASISYAKNQAYIAQEIELVATLEEEMQRSEEIETFKEYVQTDEYIEEIAKEKLNMAYPDEVIFVPLD